MGEKLLSRCLIVSLYMHFLPMQAARQVNSRNERLAGKLDGAVAEITKVCDHECCVSFCGQCA